MKNNQRKRMKQKQRHWDKVDKRHMEELYRLAMIDPDTIEGQSVLPIGDLLSKEDNKISNKPKGFLSWFGF